MLEDLPPDVKAGLDQARRDATRRTSRMRVEVGGRRFTILRHWDKGFALDAADAPNLRGWVDLYDGPRHMGRCLIVASSEERGERVFEFKQNTPVADHAPVDFAQDEFTPAGLLSHEI